MDIKDEKTKTIFLIAAVVMAVAILNFNFLSQLEFLPSPIYGGDFYSHLGTYYHIFYGGPIFASSQFLGETPWVPWLYHVYVVVLAKITGLDPMFANIYSSIPLIFITAFITYKISIRYTSDRFLIAGLILVMLWNYPLYKYTNFSFAVMAPALLLAWLMFLENRDLKNAGILTAAIGLSNLSNTQLLFANYFLFAVVALDELYKRCKSANNFSFIKDGSFQNYVKYFAMIFLLSFLISLFYWYWPIFVYKGNAPNDLFRYGWVDFSIWQNQLSYPFTYVLKPNFYNEANIFTVILSLMKIGGLFAIIALRNKDIQHRFAYLAMIASFIGLFHYLFTYNVLGVHFAPERIYEMLQIPLSVMEIAIFIEWILSKISFKYLGAIVLLLSGAAVLDHFPDMEKSEYVKMAKNPLPPEFLSLQSWINNNTELNDVILSNNEISFMVNAFTGRKVATYRRTHTSVYADVDQRMLDTAVMLYGEDDEKRVELFKKYNVKYVLWSRYWLSHEFYTDRNDELVGLGDPLLVRDRAEYRSYLERYGIRTFSTRHYLDPAWLPVYPSYDVLVVLPAYKDPYHPWTEKLDPYLKPLYLSSTVENGQKTPEFIVFKVEY